jgi:hypothetical protein
VFVCVRCTPARTPWSFKMKAVCSFETSGIGNPATQCNNSGDHSPQH